MPSVSIYITDKIYEELMKRATRSGSNVTDYILTTIYDKLGEKYEK